MWFDFGVPGEARIRTKREKNEAKKQAKKRKPKKQKQIEKKARIRLAWRLAEASGEDSGGGKKIDSGRKFRIVKVQPKTEAKKLARPDRRSPARLPEGGGSLRAYRRARLSEPAGS